MSHQEEPITVEEVKQEFQLERMILFSDAVFAIVITLMAIEIRLPESHEKVSDAEFLILFKPVINVLIAYMASFIFIGVMWFHHLRIFSLLKDYDKGLVFRNLLLLFFIGLFPFSASVVTKGISGSQIPIAIYFTTILICLIAQSILSHYILITKPELRNERPIGVFLDELHKRKISILIFVIILVLILLTNSLVKDPELKGLSTLWMLLFPIVLRFIKRRKK